MVSFGAGFAIAHQDGGPPSGKKYQTSGSRFGLNAAPKQGEADADTQPVESLLKTILWPVVVQVGITVMVMLPLAYWLWRLLRERKKQLDGREEPFTGYPIRPPGETLRLQIAAMEEQRNEMIYELLLFPLAIGLVIGNAPQMRNPIGIVAALALVAGVTWWRGPNLVRLYARLRDFNLGYLGERVVGEELNQLMLDGFHVFHDIPFDEFNIDHVIVGKQGVFAVETKTRRKPRDDDGTKQFSVTYDGRSLKWPMGEDQYGLQQTQDNARTLAAFLTSATGERVEVAGILAVPGWWVERTGRGPVNVLNEKEVKHSFSSQRKLDEDKIQRIIHQLTEKCRLDGQRLAQTIRTRRSRHAPLRQLWTGSKAGAIAKSR